MESSTIESNSTVPLDENPTEAQWWQSWRVHGDMQAREALIAHYTPFARIMAAKIYAGRYHDAIEFDEYLQFAMVGLIEALERFDPTRLVQFETYAGLRISGKILDGLEHLSEQQEQVGLKRRLRAERIDSVVQSLPAQPSAHQVFAHLAGIAMSLALGFMLEGSGLFVDHQPTLPDSAYQPVELNQVCARVRQLVRQLNPQERFIIDSCYFSEMTFEKIADELQVSIGRVSQIHRQALEHLRRLLAEQPGCDVAR